MRPSKLTRERSELVVRYVRAGLTLNLAASGAGVAERTIYRWLAAGRQPGRRYARHRALLAAVEQARAEAEVDLVASMMRAARRGSWKAACWLLEREYPERWGPPGSRPLEASEASPWL